ncbi:MAG TPA: TetR/AcrR family transcriptional regulator [Cytophagales bacterium]|nr:TetR/AcrR family transcriptional regulator [Cytophagales bacterium]
MAKKTKTEIDGSTEERIKEAARIVFTQKGYAATRTRDIAEKAGINLALLNYYFRSKEKLFNQVMLEKIQQLFGMLLPVLSDETTKLEKKIEMVVANYIDMLLANPDLPLFVLSELRGQKEELQKVLPIEKIIQNISFIKQLQEKRPDIQPIHFLMNILGMTVFPFIAMPAFDAVGIIKKNDFEKLIQERKALIPIWVKAMIKAK